MVNGMGRRFRGEGRCRRYRRGRKREWERVRVDHHEDVGKAIDEWENKGWRLHTYQVQGSPAIVNRYLLFVRED